MKKRILYVINHMDWFWSHRLDLARAARDAGWDVMVAGEGAGGDPALAENGFEGLEWRGGPPWRRIAGLRAILKREKPDCVHAITLKTAFMTGLAERGLNLPRCIFTLAGLGYLFRSSGWKPALLRRAVWPLLYPALRGRNRHIIFQNPDDRELLTGYGLADPAHSTLIPGSGVDTQKFSPGPAPQKPAAQDSARLVLMPTRLVREKGIDIFVRAAEILRGRNVQADFAIAGGPSPDNPNSISAAQMQAMLEGTAVQWLGKVADMPGLLARATLIVYPSWYGEGVPKVLLEAAACGLPVITTDHPGCREAVRHGDNGILVPVRDAAATAEAVESLLADPARRAAMGRRARERAEAEFDVRRINEQTLAVYA